MRRRIAPALSRLAELLRSVWRLLREASGDLAYERYLEHAGPEPRLSRGEFYLERLRRRYSRPNRCC